MSTAAIVAGTAAAGIGGALITSNAAGNAASTQANAADYAAQLQAQEAQNALDFQKQEFNTQQQNLAPWLSAGKLSLNNLETLLGLGGNTNAKGYGSLLEGFTPPTLAQAENYPGYQFGLQQGEEALTNSAAARGDLLSGNTQEALTKFAQNYAQNDYTNVYNQAFNTFEANQANKYNKLAALAGLGQTTATTLGNLGQSSANNIGNIMLTSGAQQGQDIQNAAAATASGYVGSANALAGGLNSLGGNLTSLLLLNQIGGLGGINGNYTPSTTPYNPPDVAYG